MKWAVIGHEYFLQRYAWLSELLKEKGFTNQLEQIDVKAEELVTKLPEILKAYDSVRVERPFRRTIMGQCPQQTHVTHSLRSADCLLKKNTGWWPDSTLYRTFNKLFSQYGDRLDLKSDVLIVGAGGMARVAIASIVKAGFGKICVTSRYDDEGYDLIKEARKVYLGVNFEFVQFDRLVMLAGTNTLLINTMPQVVANELMEELFFLNFLQPTGIIWDLVISPEKTPLCTEAEQAGITCVNGTEIAAYDDVEWSDLVCGLQLPLEIVRDHYIKNISAKSDVGLVTKNVTSE